MTSRRMALVLLLAPCLLSLAVWTVLTPHGQLTGYASRASVSAGGTVLVGLWWAAAALAVYAGASLGERRGPFARVAAVDVRRLQRLTLALGTIGSGYAYLRATDGRLSAVLAAISEQQANKIRYGLEYQAGLSTLRYAAIIAGGIAVHNIVVRRRPSLSDVLSLVVLLSVGLLASRLSILMAMFIGAGMVLFHRPMTSTNDARRQRRMLALMFVLAVVALGWLNWTRNAGFYREKGVDNVALMALWNAGSYVVTPAQAQLGYASAVVNGHADVGGGLGASLGETVSPSYLPIYQQREGVNYRKYVDVADYLTTNSSLVQLIARGGIATIWLAPLMISLVGYVFARFVSAGLSGIAFAAPLAYALAEYWRIYLFNQGIVHFVVLCALPAAVLCKSEAVDGDSALPSSKCALGALRSLRI